MSRFLVDRGIFDSPIWGDQALFRLFFFLVGKASFKDGIKIGKLELKRGQFLRSYRRLQEDLAYIDNNAQRVYSTSTLKRCVDQLVKDERIQVQETELGTLFTILNYEEYQAFSPTTSELETATEHPKPALLEGSQDENIEAANSVRTATEQQPNNKNKSNTGITNADSVDAVASKTRATRLPKDWSPSIEQIEWAKKERPGLDIALEAAKFLDHWIAQPGQKGMKTDWPATWRNWIRNSRQQPQHQVGGASLGRSSITPASQRTGGVIKI